MITCTFAGHRQVFEAGIGDKVQKMLKVLIEKDNQFVFLNGGMGRFDEICAGVVRKLKREHPEKDIRLCLVAAYFSNRFNAEKKYYQSLYDEILLPDGVETTYYKAAITKRNKWMVDQANILIAYIDHNYGGAYQTYQYANKKSVSVFNIAEEKKDAQNYGG